MTANLYSCHWNDPALPHRTGKYLFDRMFSFEPQAQDFFDHEGQTYIILARRHLEDGIMVLLVGKLAPKGYVRPK